MPTQKSEKKPFPRPVHLATGIAGLAVIGASAFLVTTKLTEHPAPEAQAPEPAVTTASPSSPADQAQADEVDPSASASEPTAPPSASVSASASPTPSFSPSTDEEKREAVKGTAQKNQKNHVLRPAPRAVKDWLPASELHATYTKTGDTTLRVVSAKADLTGQRELSWVTDVGDDGIDTVGDVSCSNRIRLTAGAPVQIKPTLLVCWRTSSGKSVYTVSVNPKGKPSEEDAAAAIDKEWARMG